MSSNILSGTAQGATSGAAMGSALMPGWGTAIGAAVGALAGAGAGYLGDNAANSASAEDAAYLARRRELAARQYDLNLSTQDTRFQTDDAGQLQTLVDSMNDPTLSLDEKLARVDREVAAGLGTESLKVATEARQLAMQQFDVTGKGGSLDLAATNLKSQLLTAKDSIAAGIQNRDANLAAGANASAALGVTGSGVERQVTAQTYSADQGIQSALRQAGFSIDALGGGSLAGFDGAVGASLAGDNTYQQQFDLEARKAKLSLRNNMDLFGADVTGLTAADGAYRSSQALSRDEANVNFDHMQWQLDQNKKTSSDWGLGLVSGLASGVGKVPAYFSAGQNISKWWNP